MKLRSSKAPPVGQPPARLVVPVLSGTGGAGRSTLAHLLASRFAAEARTVVVDAAASLASSWPHWLTRPGAGTASLPRCEPASAQQVYAAASVVAVHPGAEFCVLTDTRPPCDKRKSPRGLDTPQDLVATYGARVTVVDTGTPLLNALSAPDGAADSGPTAWVGESSVVPVLCAAATAKGITDALTTVTALEEADLPTERLHVAVVGIPADGLPRRVQAGLTLLETRVASIIRVGHEPSLRTGNQPSLSRASSALRSAIDELSQRICATAPHTGTPQPHLAGTATSEGEADVLAQPC